jgi:hypothetical protein
MLSRLANIICQYIIILKIVYVIHSKLIIKNYLIEIFK